MNVAESNPFRAQLLLPEQRQLYDYWVERSTGNQLPTRGDINPAHFPRLLPGISLIDVAGSIAESRIRLAGTRLREVFGREVTGLRLDQMDWGERWDYWMTAFARTVGSGRPSQGVVRGPRSATDHLIQYWLKLPLRNSGTGVGMILCLDCFVQATEEHAIQKRYAMA